MKPFATIVLLGLGLVACSGKSDDGTDGMSAAEMAQMDNDSGEPEMTAAEMATMDDPDLGGRRPVHLTESQQTALGVVYIAVTRENLIRIVRTVGEVRAAEPQVADVTPKIDGFVEELFVDFTGQTVREGQPLLTLYSPSMVAAQEEMLTALRLATSIDSGATEAWENAQRMLEAARRRLAYWDITPDQVAEIERTGVTNKSLTLVAPVSGIVLEKRVVSGQQVMPGMLMYRIADLTSVWIEGEVFEQDLQFVETGDQAHIEVEAYPGDHLMGRVSFIHPVVDTRTRTTRIRVAVPNPDLRLKPGMFATIYFEKSIGTTFPVIPVEAVIITGERDLVFLRDADGMLNPREVVLGARADGKVQILQGLAEGDTIVGSANYLIDSESRLASTGGGMMPGMDMGPPEDSQ